MTKTAVFVDDLPPLGTYTPAFRLGDGELIVCSGIVPVDADGKTVGVGDPAAQTRQVLENLRKVLRAAGADMDDVVSVRIFSTDMANRAAITKVRKTFFREPFPASTHVQVVRLVEADWLLEIEAIALVSKQG